MKYLFVILYYLLLLVLSNSTKPKLCVDCKFFRKNFYGNEFGTCSLFTRYEISDDSFLVDGKQRKTIVKYNYCSTARQQDSMCGKDGKLYEKNDDFFTLLFPLAHYYECPLSELIETIFIKRRFW